MYDPFDDNRRTRSAAIHEAREALSAEELEVAGRQIRSGSERIVDALAREALARCAR